MLCSLYIYLCNVVKSITVLYILYISLTIIKCNVLTCYDNNKITGALRPKVGHCDFAVGALRLGLGHSGRGALRLSFLSNISVNHIHRV